jgi:hypothetical protein
VYVDSDTLTLGRTLNLSGLDDNEIRQTEQFSYVFQDKKRRNCATIVHLIKRGNVLV